MRLLGQGHLVSGIARTQTIRHKSYTHYKVDLADLDQVKAFRFEVAPEAENLVLINNAATLGEIKPVGQLSAANIEGVYHINVTAPSVLCTFFIQQTGQFADKRIVLNISSGAAQYPVSGWSTYCASKAALNMFTEVMQRDHPLVHCMAVAPGVVDTPMQGEIRAVDASLFPEKERFIEYKQNNELASPGLVAEKLLYFVFQPDQKPGVCFSLRDV